MNKRQIRGSNAQKWGRAAETLAAQHYINQGAQILARNLRTPFGEIDLIAQQKDTVIFIEVKARKSLNDAAFAWQPRQQQRLIQAIEHYQNSLPSPLSLLRIDLVCMDPNHQIEVLENISFDL